MEWALSDLTTLIKTCRDAEILSFSLGELNLSFNPSPVQKLALGDRLPQVPATDPEAELRARTEHELQVKQDQLDHLRLSDPEAYEDLILQNDLEFAQPEEEKIAANG